MGSMKALLRLLGTAVLTSLSATTIVACGDTSNPVVTMDGTVADALGLTSNLGTIGLLAPTVTFTGTPPVNATWTIDSKGVEANSLLVGEVTTGQAAAKTGCDAFLISVLGMTRDNDGKYDAAAVAALKIKIIANNDINITPLASNTDYYVSTGTAEVQFLQADGITNIASKYSVPVKVGTAKDPTGVIKPVFPTLVVADTDVETNPNILFVIGAKIPPNVSESEVNLNPNPTQNTQIFTSLSTLIKQNLVMQVSAYWGSFNWKTGDRLSIEVKINNSDEPFVTYNFKL